MAVETAALNLAADGIATNVTSMTLHIANGTQITGGDYAAKTPTYSSASGGVAALSGPVVFDGPGTSATVTQIGLWNGATLLGMASLSASKTIGPGDTLTITAAPISVTAA